MLADDLRKSVLQAAIQGKLVEQHDSDGNVAKLIDVINVERERLVKEKVIKKMKDLSPITEDEIPFDIPDNWRWVRINDVYEVVMGSSPKGDTVGDFTEGIEFHQGKVYFSNEILANSPQKTIKPTKLTKENDVLLSVRAPVGAVNRVNREVCIGRGLCALRPYLKQMDNKYLFYTMRAIERDFIKQATGTTFIAITAEVIRCQLIPLPPLEEQKRIVAKIEEVMKIIDEYEKVEKELFVLQQTFPGDLRKSLLQAAMQGKLVEQHDFDGNVDELIQAINTERECLIKEKVIKKTKPLNPITEEEIPFDIPDSWKWIRHNEIFQVIGGSQPPKAKFISESTEGYIRLYQTRDYGNNPQPVYIPISDAKKVSKEGDILLARYGGSLGKVFWAKDGAYNVALAKVVPLYKSDLVSKKYMYYYYLSPIYQSFVQKMSRSAQAGFNKDDLNELLFPLPPLEEQKRIVEKLEKLLPLCDELV